ncbi:hypothetical protein FRB90_000619 [Tulasnella sp. 427]|nr:hypothetical protein FRB90_000619 [Tulasnella sp. 427]
MLAGTSLVELGFWQTVNGPGKPSAPLPSISTVVVRVVDGPGLPIDLVRRTLTGISWVNKSSFAKLQEVVIVGGTFEDMETPYHILALGEDHIFELACRNWDGEGVRVVNRHGVRVWNGDF